MCCVQFSDVVTRWFTHLACGPGHLELSKSYVDTASKDITVTVTVTVTFTFTCVRGGARARSQLECATCWCVCVCSTVAILSEKSPYALPVQGHNTALMPHCKHSAGMEGELRLAGSHMSLAEEQVTGRVEIFHAGAWGTLCTPLIRGDGYDVYGRDIFRLSFRQVHSPFCPCGWSFADVTIQFSGIAQFEG